MGTVPEVLAGDTVMQSEIRESTIANTKAEKEVDALLDAKEKRDVGKLVIAEEAAEGHVGWPAGMSIASVQQPSV